MLVLLLLLLLLLRHPPLMEVRRAANRLKRSLPVSLLIYVGEGAGAGRQERVDGEAVRRGRNPVLRRAEGARRRCKQRSTVPARTIRRAFEEVMFTEKNKRGILNFS